MTAVTPLSLAVAILAVALTGAALGYVAGTLYYRWQEKHKPKGEQ